MFDSGPPCNSLLEMPAAGHEQTPRLDGTKAATDFTNLILDNRDFTNLPRKLNVTITGCRENCCHPETQAGSPSSPS